MSDIFAKITLLFFNTKHFVIFFLFFCCIAGEFCGVSLSRSHTEVTAFFGGCRLTAFALRSVIHHIPNTNSQSCQCKKI